MKKGEIIIRTDKDHWKVSDEEKRILETIKPKIYEIELPEEIDNFNHAHEIFDAEAIITSNGRITKAVINKLKKLKVISRMGTGTDKIDVEYSTKLGILVINTPEFCVNETADHVLAFLLATNKKLFMWDSLLRKCNKSMKAWTEIKKNQVQNKFPIRISSRKLGIIGLGRIGRAVATRAKSFGLEVWAFDPYIEEDIFKEYQVKKASMESIFKNCEFISVNAPLTDETYHIINRKYFKMMKPEAIFINTARGAIVVEKDLIEALEKRWISGAAIDVFENFEVHGPDICIIDSPYFKLDNVILTPHISVNSDKSFLESQKTSAENVVDVLTGFWPKYIVNNDVVPKYKLKQK